VNPNRESIDVEKSDFFMPFAPLIRVKGGDLLFVSGATALPLYHQHPHEHEQLDPPSDIRAQTRIVMENLERCLRAGGATWGDVVRTDVYLVSMDDQDAAGEVMGEYFDGEFPTSTMVEVSRLVDPRLRIEVSAIAVVSS
jgi:2-iminobutanoate/2-iminopropanoate deaminase